MSQGATLTTDREDYFKSLKTAPLIPSSSIPKPPSPEIQSIVRIAGKNLSTDSQSGGILKALLDAGFKEKIQNGSQKGHIYNIIHNAPSPEFILIESWVEGDGSTRTVPTHFKIIDDSSSTPGAAPAPTQAPTTIEPKPIPPAPEAIPPMPKSPDQQLLEDVSHELDILIEKYKKFI